ncbi:MAG: AcrR family transcriptional regulator [Bacteriovoracaceae bacterium]|jgi:AcrR family transcriptional regulator
MTELSTRDIILRNSHKLFADKGFNGVSIREIAKECDVNIAAINYHFNNKENLYLQTIKESVLQTENQISKLYDMFKEKGSEKFALAIFDLFLNNSEDLRTGFKLIISSDKYTEAMGEDMPLFKGPPGGEYIYKILEAEVPTAASKDIEWAMRTILSQIIHKSLIMSNKSICQTVAKSGVTSSDLQDDIIRLIRIVKKDIE